MSKALTEKPDVWVGHISLNTKYFEQSIQFFEDVGMRCVAKMPDLCVLELRGGTHLVLARTPGGVEQPVSFDLMVDDLPMHRALIEAKGYQPTEIEKGAIHANFSVTEPSGHVIQFHDSHVVGTV